MVGFRPAQATLEARTWYDTMLKTLINHTPAQQHKIYPLIWNVIHEALIGLIERIDQYLPTTQRSVRVRRRLALQAKSLSV